MKTLGVRYIDVSSDGSTEVNKDFHHPKTFDGVLPERWRDRGEAIYEVPGVTSLAHLIRPDEIVSRMPMNGLDVEPLEKYVQAIGDPSRPAATFHWTGSRTARIRTVFEPGEYVSVQIPFHAGWKASSPEGHARLSKDALGLLLIQPKCIGECELRLEYTGGTEAVILRGLAIGGWLTVALVAFGARSRRATREYS